MMLKTSSGTSMSMLSVPIAVCFEPTLPDRKMIVNAIRSIQGLKVFPERVRRTVK